MKSLLTSVSLVVFVAIAAASTARAQPWVEHEQVASRIVNLRDVDLNTQAGAREAARRITSAADFVCSGAHTAWRQEFDYFACRNEAIDRALASLEAPLVSAALHRQPPADRQIQTDLAAR